VTSAWEVRLSWRARAWQSRQVEACEGTPGARNYQNTDGCRIKQVMELMQWLHVHARCS
jgi:hypothetical protein